MFLSSFCLCYISDQKSETTFQEPPLFSEVVSLKIYFFKNIMFESVSLHESMYITGIPSVHGSQKKV